MIEVDVVDGIGLVRLAHGKVNVLDVELCRAIEQTMHDLDAGPVRAVVVTGNGRAFSAGVDLKRVVDGGAAYVAEFLPALGRAFRSVFDLGKPVVAAVNGHAIAGSRPSWTGRCPQLRAADRAQARIQAFMGPDGRFVKDFRFLGDTGECGGRSGF